MLTNEEAIEMLNDCPARRHCHDGKAGHCDGCNVRTALDMAIKAFKTEHAVRQLIKDKIDILEDRASTENNEGRWVEDEKCCYAIEVLEEILEDIADK